MKAGFGESHESRKNFQATLCFLNTQRGILRSLCIHAVPLAVLILFFILLLVLHSSQTQKFEFFAVDLRRPDKRSLPPSPCMDRELLYGPRAAIRCISGESLNSVSSAFGNAVPAVLRGPSVFSNCCLLSVFVWCLLQTSIFVLFVAREY